jgi:16S rRNA (guanine1207-N2)-methyltransferase
MSHELLLANTPLAPTDRVLAFGADLAEAAARVSELWLHDDRVTALDAAAGSGAHVLHDVTLPAELLGSCDLALLLVPRERDLARRYLVQAQQALRPGGKLYLAGPNDGGIQPVLADASALFGLGMQLAVKQRWRVGMVVRQHDPATVPVWALAPGIAPYTWIEHEVTIDGAPLRLRSLPGVFAAGRLDAGSALLLENLRPTPGARVLDIGCGCGVLGLAARRRGAAQVDMLDVSLAALASARASVALTDTTGVRVFAGDRVTAIGGARYDLIVTNPPFHQGKQTDYETTPRLLREALPLLAPNGRLLLVANGFLPYQRLLDSAGIVVTTLASNRSYTVLEVTR